MSNETPNNIISAAISVPSLSFLKIQASLISGAPIEFEEKSTINERLDILKDKRPLPNSTPKLNLMVIGIGGHRVSIDNDNLMWHMPVAHEPTDTAPFNIQPVAVRAIDNDLTERERERFALRKQATVNGQRCWLYYGWWLPTQQARAEKKLITKIDGEEKIEDFVYSDSDLYPTPPEVSTNTLDTVTRLNSSDGKSVMTYVPKEISFDQFLTNELINASIMTRNDPLKAIVSEIVLCTSVPETVTVPAADGSSFNFKEATGVQVGISISCFHNMAMSNAGVNYIVNIGQTKPMKIRSR